MRRKERKKVSPARLPQQAFDGYQYIRSQKKFHVVTRKISVRDGRWRSVHLYSSPGPLFSL
jgi:hypothetical protein